MCAAAKAEVQRAPRIGVDPARIAFHGIDFSASEAHLVSAGVEISMKLDSIINISVSGIKVVAGDMAQPPKSGDSVVMSIKGRERAWNVKGRVAWVDPLVGGQWWLGIEFVFSADALNLHKVFSD